MASIIDVDDVRADMPQVTITDTSVPTSQQVEQFISDIGLVVRADVEATHTSWPIDYTSPASMFLRRLMLEGVRWLVLRAIFMLTNNDTKEVDRAESTFNNLRKDIPKHVVAIQTEEGTLLAGENTPAVGPPEFVAPFNATLFTATHERSWRESNHRINPRIPQLDW